MSAKQEATKAEHKTKKFGKSERAIPHHTQKAKKFYPAEDEAKPKKVCNEKSANESRYTTWCCDTATIAPVKYQWLGLNYFIATPRI